MENQKTLFDISEEKRSDIGRYICENYQNWKDLGLFFEEEIGKKICFSSLQAECGYHELPVNISKHLINRLSRFLLSLKSFVRPFENDKMILNKGSDSLFIRFPELKQNAEKIITLQDMDEEKRKKIGSYIYKAYLNWDCVGELFPTEIKEKISIAKIILDYGSHLTDEEICQNIINELAKNKLSMKTFLDAIMDNKKMQLKKGENYFFLVEEFKFLKNDLKANYEKIKDKKLIKFHEISEITRNNIAAKIVTSSSWTDLGLMFENDNPKIEPINHQSLIAMYGYEPPLILCKKLMVLLAAKGLTIKQLTRALKQHNIGMNYIVDQFPELRDNQ